ncbi:hypothetical protein ILUMI_15068, partial [Ignelater luminosus]
IIPLSKNGVCRAPVGSEDLKEAVAAAMASSPLKKMTFREVCKVYEVAEQTLNVEKFLSSGKKHHYKTIASESVADAVDVTTVKKKVIQTFTERSEMKKDVGHIEDLIAADSRYHDNCAKRFFKTEVTTHSSSEQLKGDEVFACANFICDHLKENEEECQFALQDILKNYNGYIPKIETIQKRLFERYSKGYFIISAMWDEARRKNQRDRNVESTAAIILEDI